MDGRPMRNNDHVTRELNNLPTNGISSGEWGKITKAQIRRWFSWNEQKRQFMVRCVRKNMEYDLTQCQKSVSSSYECPTIEIFRESVTFTIDGQKITVNNADDIARIYIEHFVPIPITTNSFLKPKEVDLDNNCKYFKDVMNFLLYYRIKYEVEYNLDTMIYFYDRSNKELVFVFNGTGPYRDGKLSENVITEGGYLRTKTTELTTGQFLLKELQARGVIFGNPGGQATGAIYEAISRLVRIVNALI
jgi:Holliday junction resolvase RusA-like endonuclease